MLQFGFNLAVINGTQNVVGHFIQNVHQSRTNNTLSDITLDMTWSLVVSFYDIGGMAGGLMGATVASSLGRKRGLLFINIFGIVGTLFITLSKFIRNYEIIIVGRFLIGCNCGLNTVLVPMYISEISPTTLRGRLGTLNNLGALFGLLLAMVLGIPDIFGTTEKWPYLFGFNIIPLILQSIFLPFCPESPRFLLITKQEEHMAQSALEKLRGTKNIHDELEEMKAEKRILELEPRIGLFDIVCKRDFRLPLLISVIMQLSIQLSGIIVLFYYSARLFVSSGLSVHNALYTTAGFGVTTLLMSIIFIPLIDHAGRRVLHLCGLGGMFACSIFFTVSLLLKSMYKWMRYLTVTSAFFYGTFFAVGPASIPWLILAELFTQGPRPAAMSIGMSAGWLAKIFLGLSFPYVTRWLQHYILLPFTILLAFFWIFTYLKVPETKNKTFAEIAASFKIEEEVDEA